MARDPLAWTSFQDRTKAYEKQRDLVRKLKDWIAANVSSHYQEPSSKGNTLDYRTAANDPVIRAITLQQDQANGHI